MAIYNLSNTVYYYSVGLSTILYYIISSLQAHHHKCSKLYYVFVYYAQNFTIFMFVLQVGDACGVNIGAVRSVTGGVLPRLPGPYQQSVAPDHVPRQA